MCESTEMHDIHRQKVFSQVGTKEVQWIVWWQ